MTDSETPVDVESDDPGPVPDDGEAGALAALEQANYAEAVKDYRPPAEHATQPEQVDPVPSPELAAPVTTHLRTGEAE